MENKNYGIEMLRIISMIMIPILHINGHGGILSNLKMFSLEYYLVWILEIVCYCAVNCYGLISGYVGYKSHNYVRKLLYTYFQTIFYTVIITTIARICDPSLVEWKDILKAVFPFAFKSMYWYYSTYFCLVLVMPILNKMLEVFSEKAMKSSIVLIIITFSIIPTILHYDFSGTLDGYSVLWLSVLYLIGGYINKYHISEKERAKKSIFGFFICILITCISKFIIEIMSDVILGKQIAGNILLGYTSPTILFSAIFLLIYISGKSYRKYTIRFIEIFAPASFSVYLIHDNPFIREAFMVDRFIIYLSYNPFIVICSIILTGIFIWMICSLIDLIRQKIFCFLRVNRLCISVNKHVIEKYQKICD